MQPLPRPILFIDIDGTVRKGFDEIGKFVNGPEDVEVFPEIPAILKSFKEASWRIVGITNQGGVALGHLSRATCDAALVETHVKCGEVFDRICVCIHHPSAEDPDMAECWCRKPRIGMIVESTIILGAMHNEFYPPYMALLVGDRDEDRQCAANAGIRFMPAAEFRRGVSPLEICQMV